MGTRTYRWAAAVAAGLVAVATLGVVPPSGPSVAGAAVDSITGQVQDNFWLATPSGTVLPYGVPDYGSPAGPLNRPVVGITTTGDRHGYWMVAGDGGVFTYGDAHFYGSTGSLVLNKPIVGIAPTPDQHGYWMVATDGGVFSFGDAVFYGSTGSLTLNKPIVAMAPTPDGRGYWLVASDGGVFSFGDAQFYGSTGSLTLQQPIVGMAPTPDGRGYWLVAADGGVFTFGDATFHGSAADNPGDPVERLVPTASGHGYWVVQQNGTAYAYGDATGLTPPPLALLLTPATPGDQAVLFAFQQLGKPYIWGGNGPEGYDCSGLALASWSQAAGIGFARVADDQYHTAGVPVAMTSLRAGDLVFWGDSQTDWTTVYHTAIYVGGNRIVEATGDQVQLNDLDQWGTGQLMPNGRRP
ncbi:MAG: C40 family peptidase [Acidimicrobiales bacterium]